MQKLQKQQLAVEALKLVPEGHIIGLGTGNTVKYFIEALAEAKLDVPGYVVSSKSTYELATLHKLPIVETTTDIKAYFDSADLFNSLNELSKGGGGALTQEKILAASSERFICLVDYTKGPKRLDKGPIALEVIPMSRSFVATQVVKLNGRPELRDNFITDNGNLILDVYELEIMQPIAMEERLNTIPGVVENGIFAKNTPDLLLVADENNQITTL